MEKSLYIIAFQSLPRAFLAAFSQLPSSGTEDSYLNDGLKAVVLALILSLCLCALGSLSGPLFPHMFDLTVSKVPFYLGFF